MAIPAGTLPTGTPHGPTSHADLLPIPRGATWQVSREEFHKAIPAIGLNVPKKDINALFDTWDKGGDGAIGYKELSKILKESKKSLNKKEGAPSIKSAASTAAAVAAFGLKSKGAASAEAPA